jgi:tripartite-type tricarboxylate transporter receptor subunit TctC
MILPIKQDRFLEEDRMTRTCSPALPVFSSAAAAPGARVIALAGVLAALAFAPSAHAASAVPGLPNKTVVIIVPNAAGGPSDLLGRLIAPKLGEAIKQNVIVDNRPSNNGVLAGELASRGAPDGSVLAVGNTGTNAINATLYKRLAYDPIKDFVPITGVMSGGLVAVANPTLPANSMKELIAYAKKAPGKVVIAIAGATGEIATNALKQQAGIDITNVNYKGGAPAVAAILSNESHLTLTNYSSVSGHVTSGKLKLIGVTSAKRDPLLPNVPTFAESGLEGYDVEMWYGFFAPVKTPPAIVQAYYREITRIAALPEVRDKLVAGGYEVVLSNPEQFGARVKRDYEKFRKIILDHNMQLD